MAEPEPLQQLGRTYVRVGSRKLSYFSGCDYFRLSSHPEVKAAVASGLKEFGLNVAASRLTTGNHLVYQALERELEKFFDSEDALLVSNGYATNTIVAQALAGNFSHALLDDRAHPSLIDAARFLDCPVLRFKHLDAGALAQTVRRCGPGSKLIVLTDGMFASDGSAAPLKEYLAILPRDATILVDDAHAAGVLGPSGKGSLEHAGATRQRIIQTITLSKAFGTYGGVVLGTATLRRRIVERSLAFIGSTPVPLPLANAARTALHVLRKDKALRARLFQNAAFVKRALLGAGLLAEQTPGPIVALVPKNSRQTRRIKKALLSARIYPPFLKYPGGPIGGLFRFAISSEHSREQLNKLLRALIGIGPFEP